MMTFRDVRTLLVGVALGAAATVTALRLGAPPPAPAPRPARAAGPAVGLRPALPRETSAGDAAAAAAAAVGVGGRAGVPTDREGASSGLPRAPAAAPGEATSAAGSDPAARALRLRALLEARDGAGLVRLLRELLALGETGFGEAAEISSRLLADVVGERRLGLDERAFYRALAAERAIAFLAWVLARPEADSALRRVAVDRLAWAEDDVAVPLFVERLGQEADEAVAQDLVAALADRGDARALAALLDALRGGTGAAAVRAAVAESLAEREEEGVEPALREAQATDPDPDVRGAATATLLLRDPPAAGVLFLRVYPGAAGAASGLQSGDLLIRWNGQPIGGEADLAALEARAAGAAGAAGAPAGVVLTVLRAGRELELPAPGGPLGVEGRAVAPRR